MDGDPYESLDENSESGVSEARQSLVDRSSFRGPVKCPTGMVLLGLFIACSSIRHAQLMFNTPGISDQTVIESLVADIISVVVGVGLLAMRKWAVVVYFALYVFGILLTVWRTSVGDVLSTIFQPPWFLVIVPTAVLVLAAKHWHKMTWGRFINKMVGHL